MIRIPNLKLPINKITDQHSEQKALENTLISKLQIKPKDLQDFKIFKKSVDARKKESLFYVYTLDVTCKNENTLLKKLSKKGVSSTPNLSYKPLPMGSKPLETRPIIIGMGPAGLFSALTLAKKGYAPIILERGEDVDSRAAKISHFWETGILDSESNVQFGEGGAGTFSDGKLTTLINDPRCRLVLQSFIKAGAPEEILYKSKPHIGTDLLRETVKNLRKEIIAYGGEIHFKSKVTDFLIEENALKALVINDSETIPCTVALLGLGHSARDTFRILHSRGVFMTQKPFSIGVRVEHPQSLIDFSQYGISHDHPGLGAAEYKLSYHSPSLRSAYTFCMCPGGYVVAAASEENKLVTNGMSLHERAGTNANAALLVGVHPSDFLSDHPLAGIAFQEKWESLAYQLGGGGFNAPGQLIGDFLEDRLSTQWGKVSPTYKPGVHFSMIKECLPDYVTQTIKEAFLYFDTKIKGYAMADGIITGIETRSSSPVRINRDENNLSNIKGLYPMGEGAGYAGGIMSSAVDGLKTAEKLMVQHAPFQGIKKETDEK